MSDVWSYSAIHNGACKVIEEQTLWEQTVCRVWLPNQDAVVRVPRSALRPLTVELQPEIEAGRIAYIAATDKARDRWSVPDPTERAIWRRGEKRDRFKEFEEYKQVKKKLKVFRLEAVRAGFKKAWQERDYSVIITVAEKIPNKILEEDPKLLMWYDQAVTRMGGE